MRVDHALYCEWHRWYRARGLGDLRASKHATAKARKSKRPVW